MCHICVAVRHMPLDRALSMIAQWMSQHDNSECVDALIGRLIGAVDGEDDAEANAAWEQSRHR